MIKKMINILLISIIVVSLSLIGKELYEYYKDSKTYSEVEEYKPKVDRVESYIMDEELLKGINDDYKLWITIDGTNIDYPVVQADDNEKYLHTNFYGEQSKSGTIFLDCSTEVDEDKNLIIYGHNMKNKTMFENITRFKNQTNFENGEIKIIRDGKEYIYEIFSVFVENEKDVQLKNKFNSSIEYSEYINGLKEKSIYNKEINNSDYQNIITLYTCSYGYEGARTIVCATLKKQIK